MHKAVHTSIILSLIGRICMAVGGELVIGRLLQLLYVPDDVFSSYALLYIRIYLLGMPVILLYNFESAVFRSIGETKTPFKALVTAGVLNVLLNLFFVIGLYRTVDGVAAATVIAHSVSALLLYSKLIHTPRVI